jgi:hypothetical protein
MLSISRKPTTHCPKCESASVYRSKRRGVAELLLHRVLFISPFRCYDCDDRHYRFRSPRPIAKGLHDPDKKEHPA